MKKYIIMLFATTLFFVATPSQALDFSKKTGDTLMTGNKHDSSLGNPLLGDMGGYKYKKKKAVYVPKRKKKTWEKIEDGFKSFMGL